MQRQNESYGPDSINLELKMDDEKYLESVLLMIKKRNGSGFADNPEVKQIIHETNQLMRTGIIVQLLKSIRTEILQLCSTTVRAASSNVTKAPNIQLIRLKVDIIFFAFYQSQIEEEEAKLLLGLIKLLSDVLASRDIASQPSTVGPTSSQLQSSQPLQISSMQPSMDSTVDWYPSFYSLLVILQLAHVCAMQQTTYLLSRRVDYSQYQTIDDLEEGNTLSQAAMGPRCGMELGGGEEQRWRCDGARGFTCLSFAIFRQPEVDAGLAPAAEVEWFLHAASRLRAYSYVRLCMLPVLRAAYLHDQERSVFYVMVLCELLENLSKVFCMTHYRQVHAHNENDFPYLFFPPTKDFYQQNADFYDQQADALQVCDLKATANTATASEADSLDDVLSTYIAILEMRPEFAQVFWPLQSQSHELHRHTLDHLYHPFVMKAVDASYHHPTLILVAIRFIATLSDAPLGRTAYAGYLFVADSSNPRLSWPHFFDCMDKIALQMGATPPTITSSSSAGLGITAMGQSRFGAGTMSLGSRSQQGLQPLIPRSSAPFHLSDKDVEGLTAIMKLIAAVAGHPSAASQLHEVHRPVPRLFALLSCAVPISLKGAILVALASLARTMSSLADEVWQLIESYRLVPHSGGSVGAAGRKAGGVHAMKGLRIELEEAESRAGRYPVTEGFLRLLDALLGHGVPDSFLGRGYRRPGLMVYLDYLIDDLLLKSADRLYAPQEWPCARSQRWRVVALVLKVLCTVLQRYGINAIAADTIPEAEALLKSRSSDDASADREVVADFREDACEYLIASHHPGATAPEVSPQRCQRPKTAGFMLMSLLLSRSKLFEYLASILTECDARSLEKGFEEHCGSEIGVAVDLLQRLYQETHPQPVHASQHRSDALADFSFAMGPLFGGGGGYKAKSTPTAAERLQLSEVGREEYLCDATFWQERALTCAVGLLYECALRESKYMSFYRSCNTQLTLTRTAEQGRAVVSPVIVHDLSDLLSNYIGDRSVLALVAQVVHLPVRSNPSVPPVHVLGVRLLEHTALHLSAHRLLSDLLVQTPTSSSAVRAADGLVAGCAAAIRDGHDIASELSSSGTSLNYDIVCMGGEVLPLFFTLSNEHTAVEEKEVDVTPYHTYMDMVSASDEGRMDGQYLQALRHGASMREAVLQLLLSTLTPTSYCLSHRLLGLAATSPAVDQSLAVAVDDEGCLHAVLQILAPDRAPPGTSFIQQFPGQAADCFELIYRLCASPVTSKTVLRVLADRHVDYMRVQLTMVLYLMHLSDEELLEGVYVQAGEESNGFIAVKAIQASICTCLGWLLKVCSLYLLQKTGSIVDGGSYGRSIHAGEVLAMLFGSCRQLSFARERSSDLSVIEMAMQYASSRVMDRAQTNYEVLSGGGPELQSQVLAASADQCLGRAGSGWGLLNQFLVRDVSSGDACVHPVIDVRVLGASLRPIVFDNLLTTSYAAVQRHTEAVLQSAILTNVFQKDLAVRAHLLRSLCQLVDVVASSGRTLTDLLLPGWGTAGSDGRAGTFRLDVVDYVGGDGIDTIARQLFEHVFVPAAKVLLTDRLHEGVLQMPRLKETFARMILSLVHVFTGGLEGGSSSPVSSPRPSSPSLAPEQFQQLFRLQLQLLVGTGDGLLMGGGASFQRSHGGGDAGTRAHHFKGAMEGSATYRGLLSASITATIEAAQQCSRGTSPVGIIDFSASRGAEEDKSQYLDEGGLRDRLQWGDEYRSIVVQALEERVSEVVEVMARDATAKGGSVAWRRCCLCALGSVVSVLGSTDSHYAGNILGKRSGLNLTYYHQHHRGGSFALVQVLKLLVQRGYLQSIVSAIGQLNGELSTMMSLHSEDDDDEVFLASVGLCTRIANSSVEGLEALQAVHVMDRMVSLSCFLDPPPLRGELVAYYGGGDQHDEVSREMALHKMHRRFSACTDLIRSMFAANPLSQTLATNTAAFLRKNNLLVSQIVRLRYLSLDGLAMAEAVCSMLAMVAAVPFNNDEWQPPKASRDSMSQQVMGVDKSAVPAPGVFDLLGPMADGFTRDLTMLLGLMGSHPLPAVLTSPFRPSSAVSNQQEWWTHIPPSSDLERRWSHMSAMGMDATEMLSTGWSMFDEKKLDRGLAVLTHTAVYLRLVTARMGSRSIADMMQLVKIPLVADVFCKCSALSLQLSSSESVTSSLLADASTEDAATGISWLRSPLPATIRSTPFSATGNRSGLDIDDSQTVSHRHRNGGSYVISSGQSPLRGLSTNEKPSPMGGKLVIAEKLLLISENLLCVIYSLLDAMRSHGEQLQSHELDCVRRVLSAAALHPPHCFITQAARWIKDLLT